MSDREQLYHALLRCAADAAQAIGEDRCAEAAAYLDRAIDLAGQTDRCPPSVGEDHVPPLAPLCARLLAAQAALLQHSTDTARTALLALPTPSEPFT